MMDRLDRIVALDEIKTLKARYFRFLDTKDWVGLAGVYAHDAEFDARWSFRGFGITDEEFLANSVFKGREAIIEFAQQTAGLLQTMHHGHQPEIEFSSEIKANGIWPFEDQLWWPSPDVAGTPAIVASDGKPARHLQGFGHYFDEYIYSDNKWLISRTEPRHLRVDRWS